MFVGEEVVDTRDPKYDPAEEKPEEVAVVFRVFF